MKSRDKIILYVIPAPQCCLWGMLTYTVGTFSFKIKCLKKKGALYDERKLGRLCDTINYDFLILLIVYRSIPYM